MNKKGFISLTMIFTFIITFLMLLLLIMNTYVNNRYTYARVKNKIKDNIYAIAKYSENINEMKTELSNYRYTGEPNINEILLQDFTGKQYKLITTHEMENNKVLFSLEYIEGGSIKIWEFYIDSEQDVTINSEEANKLTISLNNNLINDSVNIFKAMESPED